MPACSGKLRVAQREGEYGFFATSVRGGRIHAAWLLLHVESGIGLAACNFGLADCAFLFHDSLHAAVVCAQTTRLAVQLDVRAVWDVHRGVRSDARDGSVEFVARAILAGGRAEGGDGAGVCGDGDSAGATGAAGAGAAEPERLGTGERGAGK